VSDIPVTADAVDQFPFGVDVHPTGDRFVTAEAVGPEDSLIERPDPDRFVKIPGGEGFAVVEAVKAFDRPMAEEIHGRMAIVAGCRGFMRSPVPVVEMAPHDVAIHADFRVVLQIGRALGEKEGEPTQAGNDSGQNTENKKRPPFYGGDQILLSGPAVQGGFILSGNGFFSKPVDCDKKHRSR